MKESSTETNAVLIDRILANRKWTQEQLAVELAVRPEAISRWRAGAGMHKRNYSALLKLDIGEPQDAHAEPLMQGMSFPLSLRIPHNSVKVSLDANGDIIVSFKIGEIMREGK